MSSCGTFSLYIFLKPLFMNSYFTSYKKLTSLKHLNKVVDSPAKSRLSNLFVIEEIITLLPVAIMFE